MLAREPADERNIAEMTTPERRRVGRVTVLARVRTVFGLLSAMRMRDLKSAIRLINVRYGRGLPFVRFLRFLGWALNAVWSEIPDSQPWVTTDEKIFNTPYWLTAANPLKNHPWASDPRSRLPERAHTVVVGAGFGGAAVAYHWSKQATEPLVVLEGKEAASGSAGRNGGILVMAGGHLHGYYVYERVIRYLLGNQAQMPNHDRRELAERFADAYVRATHSSHEMIKETIVGEGIECDYARRGWVFFTDSIDAHTLEASLALARRLGHDDWVRRTPVQVHERSGVDVSTDGAESLGGATWHPAKWVWGILSVAVRSSNVRLFTHTSVEKIERDGDSYAIRTNRGTIRSRFLVNATESHTPVVFRDFLAPFPDLITPYKEQGMHAEGGPDSMRPGVGVSGPLGFYTRVADGGMLFGSDNTAVAPHEAGKNEPSRFITRYSCVSILKNWKPSHMRVTHEWTGTTSTTPDKFPVIGPMDDNGLYIIGGFAGAGSAVSFNAGQTIVRRILGIADATNNHPEEYFSPMRFTDPQRYGRRPNQAPAEAAE